MFLGLFGVCSSVFLGGCLVCIAVFSWCVFECVASVVGVEFPAQPADVQQQQHHREGQWHHQHIVSQAKLFHCKL